MGWEEKNLPLLEGRRLSRGFCPARWITEELLGFVDLLKVLDPTVCHAPCLLLSPAQAPVGFCVQVGSATQTARTQGR